MGFQWVLIVLQSMQHNPFQPSVAFHVETSHLFSRAKQMTGFYIKCSTGLKCVNSLTAGAN